MTLGFTDPKPPLACDLDGPVEALQKPGIRVDVDGNGIVVDGETFKMVPLPPLPRGWAGVLFVEAPQSEEEIEAVAGVFSETSLLFN